MMLAHTAPFSMSVAMGKNGVVLGLGYSF